MFDSPFSVGLISKAVAKGSVKIVCHDIRKYATDSHNTVDDYPFGGGAGMVMKPEPIFSAVENLQSSNLIGDKSRIIVMSPQGRVFDNKIAKELTQYNELVFICGRYEGIDERVFEYIDEEISIGDYVLTNGCLSAIVLVDVIMRFIPGSLGHRLSVEQDSFENGIFDCPHYTRPEVFNNKKVPEVLLGGHHRLIDEWRDEQSLNKTIKIRPDLLDKYHPRGDVVDKSIEEKELK